MVVRVTKQFTFEMAHALLGHDGPCSGIHGHSYGLSVTLKGKVLNLPSDPKTGMVFDFADLKRIVHEAVIRPFDHALVLNKDTADGLLHALQDQKLLLVAFQPTCENLCSHFAGRLIGMLPRDVELHRVSLRETATSFAEWFAEDNLTIPYETPA